MLKNEFRRASSSSDSSFEMEMIEKRSLHSHLTRMPSYFRELRRLILSHIFSVNHCVYLSQHVSRYVPYNIRLFTRFHRYQLSVFLFLCSSFVFFIFLKNTFFFSDDKNILFNFTIGQPYCNKYFRSERIEKVFSLIVLH